MRKLSLFSIYLTNGAMIFLAAYYFTGYQNYLPDQRINFFRDIPLILVTALALVVFIIQVNYQTRETKKFGNPLFIIKDYPLKILALAISHFAFYLIYNAVKLLLMYNYFPMLLILMMICTEFNILLLYSTAKCGFSHRGIAYRGTYYNWKDVKHYEWIGRNKIKIICTTNRFLLSFRKRLILRVESGKSNNIEALLRSNVILQ